MKKLLALLLTCLSLAACGQAVPSAQVQNSLPPESPTSIISPSVQTSPLTSSESHSAWLSGKVKDLADLHLTPLARDPSSSTGTYEQILPDGQKQIIDPSRPEKVYYKEAGMFTHGTYAGYKRIIAIAIYDCPCEPTFATLATKDDLHYVLDTTDADVYENKLDQLDAKTVDQRDVLPSDHPKTIEVGGNFILNRGAPYYSWDSQNDNTILTNDLQDYQSLMLPNLSLRFYTPLPPRPSAPINYKEIAFAGNTELIALDSTGLAYRYYLTTPQAVNSYNESKNSANPEYAPPHLSFPKSRITTSSPVYETYDASFTVGCSLGPDTKVAKGITDQDLSKIGTVDTIDLYTLKNKNHPILKAAYDFKIVDEDGSDLKKQYRESKNQKKPTFAQYVASNPLLFIKDPWQRIVVIQENHYLVPRECGKPVVYLYPSVPTKVNLSFEAPISFSTTIPTYHQGWQVLAYPNGKLTDLQPQFTDCATIDSSKIGSEYAKQACVTNQYPYLYWAGQVQGKTYPQPQKGWVVAKADVEQFMNNTLDSIGFTAQEKNDMLAYWVPEMLSKDSPYYRISFLQTEEMNKFAPMKISPAPESIYRLFLDYAPLAKNDISLQPQSLTKVKRQGFTMVEWGGLKQ